jgi:acetylornithine/succinyldiaminopimelate/putrescine aminotransferase
MKTDIFSEHLAQTTPFPFGIKVSHAEGSYIYDTDGKSYLDLISGIAVSYLGHGRQEIKAAIKDQVDKHLHVMVYGEFEQEAQNELAEELKRTLPESLQSFYFVNSGTEANEAALKLAKRATGRSQLISFKGAYHGSTHGSLSVSSNEIKKNPFRPLLPNIHFIELNNFDQLQYITEQTAGVILESIQGDAGVRIPSKEFMQALRKRCSEVGALLILDEIQSGMGRSGKMWAFEHYDLVPDIMTSGKALGGGMPIGCMATSKERMHKLSINPILAHITTFGGHPLVCAAAAAGLKVLRKEKLIEQVEEKAKWINDLLSHQRIRAVRNRGLMFAVELESADQVQQVVLNGLQKGILLFWFLSTPNAFRLAPPLTISKNEIEKGMRIIMELLDEL